MTETLWKQLADVVSIMLAHKLKEPLNGADMVQIFSAWREMRRK